MQPTLNMNVDNANIDGDTVYINRVRDIEFNDLVVAHVSWWSKGDIVKRLVGLPGDKIEIRNLGAEYGLYINEDLLYTKEINDTTQTHFEAYTKFINNHSSYGIDFTNNIGQTELGNKCIKLNDGEYFLIGDNWGESTDCLTNGPIVKENIIGRIELVIPYGTQFTLPIILEFMFKHLF